MAFIGTILGWLGGNRYVVGALVLALIGAGGYGLYQYGRAENANARAVRAQARADDLTQQRDAALTAVKQAEADKAALVASIAKLDALLTQQKARIAALQSQKQKLQEAYDEIAQTVAPEDQACLSRSLPPAIAERLLGGPDNSGPLPEAAHS